MNKVVLMGRLTRDPEVRYTQGDNPMAIARYTLAVDRRFKREGEATADFISCITFGKQAEFAEKYFRQGLKIIVCGRIQTGSYTNREDPVSPPLSESGQEIIYFRSGNYDITCCTECTK